MKTVLLLLSHDRFSIPLIRYLGIEGKRYGWKTCIGSMFESSFIERIKAEKISNDILFVNIADYKQCDQAIRKADLVIGMVPDVMLLQVADSCIAHKKTLISPSRLNRQLFKKKAEAEENGVLLLVECGFTPGLDHITAKKIVDNIHAKGGRISSFKTYSGSLVAESSIDNPWEFKLTELTADLVNFGRGNNRHMIEGHLQHVPYTQLFTRGEPIYVSGFGDALAIPEEDALYCRKVYDLTEAQTVIKGKIIRKGFEGTWDLLIRLGLTNTTQKIDLFDNKSFRAFLQSLLPYAPSETLENALMKYANANFEDVVKLKWLGLFGEEWLEGYRELAPATILQHLLEQKLSLQSDDKDCVVMRHELEYANRNYRHHFIATLVAQGEDARNSATAKAIGLTTGAAAKAVLLGDIKLKGLHTPVKRELYDPILNELDDHGVAFHVEERKIPMDEVTSLVETPSENHS